MFLVNVKKCRKIFRRVIVSTDSLKIARAAARAGADYRLRGEHLCGDTPNIPVYRHAVCMIGHHYDYIIAVQANSPTVSPKIIEKVKRLMEKGNQEVITSHPNGSIYGSVWAMTKKRLEEYKDFYNPNPDVLVVDKSVDIHTQEDYEQALCQKYSS